MENNDIIEEHELAEVMVGSGNDVFTEKGRIEIYSDGAVIVFNKNGEMSLRTNTKLCSIKPILPKHR
jgi:stress response protein SCP2